MFIDETIDEEGYDNSTELSDWSFKDTPEKTSFNTSMGNFSADWTSLKHQLGSDLNSIRDATLGKKSRMKNASNNRTKKGKKPNYLGAWPKHWIKFLIEMLKSSFYQLFVVRMLMINMFISKMNLLICLKG